MNIVLLGPPGAGKGTQAAALAERHSLQWISTGDMLREIVAARGELSEMIRTIMDKGGLIPDRIMLGMLKSRIHPNPRGKKGFLLDGFPRTFEQAQSLDAMLEERNLRLNAVIHIRLADSRIVERISGRMHCADCGAGYHAVFQPPRTAGICDWCGSENLTRRSDDSPSLVEKRLRAHHEKTAPLLPYYRQRGILHDIDGEGSVEDVRGRIEAMAGALGPADEKKREHACD